MEILVQVSTIVAPVFLLAAAGFAWVKLKFEFDLDFVTRLAVQFGLPCLIFTALVEAELSLEAVIVLTQATLVGYFAVAVISALLIRILGRSMRVYLVPIVFGNTGNVGLPLALFAFGTEGLTSALVVFTTMMIMKFTLGAWFVSGSNSKDMLKIPMVYAAILGLALMFLDVTPPEWIMNSAKLAGQIAIPLMLITLGVAIARLTADDILFAFLISVAKLVIGLATGVAVVSLLGLPEGAVAGAFVLQMIMPVAVTSYLIANQFKASPEAVAGLVMASTLVCVPAIPLVLAFLL